MADENKINTDLMLKVPKLKWVSIKVIQFDNLARELNKYTVIQITNIIIENRTSYPYYSLLALVECTE